MTQNAGIRDLVSLCHRRADETEGMGADEGGWNAFALHLGHVAGDALAAGTVGSVVGMLL